MTTENKSVFETLSEIDISDKVKEKNKMKYLPWNVAWELVKNCYPTATRQTIKDANGCIYHTDGKTAWVETVVTIEDETIEQTLAVMDFKNASIPVDKLTSTDVEKSIQRCLTKNLAMFGLGLSLWSGEEFSDAAKAKKQKDDAEEAKLKALQKQLLDLCKEKSAKIESEKLYQVLEAQTGYRNPNKIPTIADCKMAIVAINELK